MKRLLVLAGLTLPLAGCPGDDYDALTVKWYCGFGAVSVAQYRGCVEHVTYEDYQRALARGSGAAERASICEDNYADPDFSANLIRQCNYVIPGKYSDKWD